MSWSVQAHGKAAAVASRVAIGIAQSKCSEPEETIKNEIGATLAKALAAFPPGMAVKVSASGSQGYLDFSKNPAEAYNSLSVSIEPMHGFLDG